jgi:hypothetical protein
VWFPLVPGTKRPAVAYSKPENLRTDAPPTETYGLPTGPLNGFWALDIDRKDGKDGLRELIAYADEAPGRDLPDTYTVRTPSGGLHLYFQWDEAKPIGNRKGILPGLDARGRGGLVVAGGEYTIALDVPIAVAPDWLIELVGIRGETPPGESAVAITPTHPEWSFRLRTATAFLEKVPPCIEGQDGQGQIWAICLRLMRTYELPIATAMELITPYNARCKPPWPEADWKRTLARAAELGQGATGMFPQGFVLGGDPGAEKSSADALEKGGSPSGAEICSAGSAESWRRPASAPRSPNRFDLSVSVAGGVGKMYPYDAKQLAGVFTGPSASPDWVGVWQCDTFRKRTIAVDPPLPLDAETIGLTESDKMRIQVWCACIGIKASIESIGAAIVVAASCATYHPIADYLAALPRVDANQARAYFDGIAGRLWGAPESRNELESSHVRRFAIAAVRRIRRPGTKVDTMLMLAGDQGFRKSSFAARLFGEYFRDQMPNVRAQEEMSIAIEGYWGIEIAELAAFGRADEGIKKEFISRSEDKYRPKYGRSTLVCPRQCVFIGTTNEDDFLRDPTGSTRYDVCEVLRPIDLEALDRDEFWAAACALESAGDTHTRARAAAGRDAAEHGRHEGDDPWTGVVLAYAGRSTAGTVTASDALTYGVPIEVAKQRADDLVRVKGILRRAFGPSKVRWIDGRSQRIYAVPTVAPIAGEASSTPPDARPFFPST